MDALLAFAAALLALRLSGMLARRWRERGDPQLAAWAAALAAYALASAALAWGAASGWSDASFRVYYLFGGLLTAPLLGVGSLLLIGRRWAAPLGLLYTGLAVGVAIAVPLTAPVTGDSIPEAQDHLDFVPARLLAVLGNSIGTVLVDRDRAPDDPPPAGRERPDRRRSRGRRRGSGLAGLGVAETAAFVALAAVLLYAGFVWTKASARRLTTPNIAERLPGRH